MDVITMIGRRAPAFLGLVLCGAIAASGGDDANPDLAIKPGKGAAPGEKRDEIVTAKAYLSVDKLPAGRTCQIAVVLDIRPEWHINQNPSDPSYLVPTKFTLVAKQGSTLGQIAYPKGQPLHVEGMDKPIMVYEKQVAIRGTLTVPKEAAGKVEEFELVVNYQACNDKECKAPTKVKLNGKVPVAFPGDPIKSVNKNVFGGTTLR
jgi:hypothetical protein